MTSGQYYEIISNEISRNNLIKLLDKMEVDEDITVTEFDNLLLAWCDRYDNL